MSRRERWLFTAMQVLTVVVVVGLLIWSIIESQKVATQRAEVAQQAAQHNRRQIDQLDRIVREIRSAQVNQREAFRKLAARNEVLHGRDPAEAPRFDPLPSADEPADEPASEPAPDTADDQPGRDPPDPPRRPDRPNRNPPDDPEPEPAPSVCVPAVNVCVRLGGPDA